MGTTLELAKPAPKAIKPIVSRRPIDMVHLAKQALGDPGLEIEILRTFDERLAAQFAGLENSVSVPDLLRHLDVIRKASVGVGAWSLAEHAHVMETELKGGEPVSPERVDDIHMAVEEVREFISGRIALDDAENG